MLQDKNPNNKEQAEAKFKEVSEAYEVRALSITAVPLLGRSSALACHASQP